MKGRMIALGSLSNKYSGISKIPLRNFFFLSFLSSPGTGREMYVFYSVLTSTFMDNLPKNTVFISLAHCMQVSAL